MTITRIDELVPIDPTPDLLREMEQRGLVGYYTAHPAGGGDWFTVLKTRDGLYLRAAEIIHVMDSATIRPIRMRKNPNPKSRESRPKSRKSALSFPIRFGDLDGKEKRHAWIARKIEQLRKERYPEKQAIAIAYSEMRQAMDLANRRIPPDLREKKKAAIQRNPRTTKQERLRGAMKLYSGFREERPDRVGEHALPADDTGVVMGDCIGIVYQTTVDGRKEKFMHQFTARAAPMLAASWDGKSLYLLGGRYRVGPRGIVDQRG